ncbi:hypothetical protein VOI32_38180 [Paraburkholderia caribensis]|uniref:Uncharacterized protein n=2 Tax=Paraburkholderia TaxID=1822464 RepID=B2JXI3_PARP8|nr:MULTISPECIES: hypothetical protein [Paraburkholderia]ACC76341.1 hypothetical protein Bphy_7359 [Paraburkholderia phymatum STM815]MCO4882453.1 hypothetical protein [Paraburkholderia caribensis]PTB24214.1 hypothetical protein C9I56_34970 [Paraburkholderia caribensis]
MPEEKKNAASDASAKATTQGARTWKAAGKWLAAHLCRVLLTIVVLIFVGLVAAGRSGKLTILEDTVMTIEPDRALPADCTSLLGEVAKLKAALGDQTGQLSSQQRDVIDFETRGAVPGKTGSWGTAKPDGNGWGSELYEDENKWKSITPQRKAVAESFDKITAKLNSLQQPCKLQ